MRTHVTFILDSSGSMSSIRDDTIGGFNSFLEDQRDASGRATVALYDFNTMVERVYKAKPIEEAPEIDAETYIPSGQTALHDAIVTGVRETETHIQELPRKVRPENVIVVVLTDGKENASETPQERVREVVETYREEEDWEFLFIGANQDAALTATSMGMDAENSLSMAHSGEGAQAAYESTSESIRHAREEGQTGGYDADDRERQREASDSDGPN
jgi:uncharacterized protein YegL